MDKSISEKEQQINIAIAEGHPIMRRGIRDIVTASHFNVQIETANGVELMNELKAAQTLPDICIVDMSMAGLNGYNLVKRIREQWALLKVLVFSEYYEEYSVLEMLRIGANGYLKKSCMPQELTKALVNIYYNDYYAENMSKNVLDMHHHRRILFPKITDREMEFLQHCCSDLHYKEIGELMGVSKRTVETFRNALFDKLNIKTRIGLVMFAMQNGIVTPNKQLVDNS